MSCKTAVRYAGGVAIIDVSAASPWGKGPGCSAT